MDRDNFYVHIVSAHSKEFIDNKNNKFTTIIKPSLLLGGDYQVSIENVLFREKFIVIKKNDPNYWIRLSVQELSNESEIIYNEIFVYKPSSDFTAESVEDIISRLNYDLLQMVQLNAIADIPNRMGDIVSIIDGRIHFTPLKTYRVRDERTKVYSAFWSFSDSWKKILGFPTDGEESEIAYSNENRVPIPVARPKMPDVVPSLIFIYTDIVETSYLADQSTTLLDILPRGGIYSKNRTLAPFKHVSKSFIDSVSILMLDEFGEPVPFSDDVNITIVLHFKKM